MHNFGCVSMKRLGACMRMLGACLWNSWVHVHGTADAVRGKRTRYPPEGGELVPLIFEAGGRPAEETVAYVRSLGLEVDSAEHTQVMRLA